MKLPGTVPPNVQYIYLTPFVISPSRSWISRSTISFLAFRLPTGVGTNGGGVSSATISRLTGISVASAYFFCDWSFTQLAKIAKVVAATINLVIRFLLILTIMLVGFNDLNFTMK